MTRTTSPRPGIYRCPRCRTVVVLVHASRTLCLPCGRVMERLPGEPSAEQADASHLAHLLKGLEA